MPGVPGRPLWAAMAAGACEGSPGSQSQHETDARLGPAMRQLSMGAGTGGLRKKEQGQRHKDEVQSSSENNQRH